MDITAFTTKIQNYHNFQSRWKTLQMKEFHLEENVQEYKLNA